MVSMLFARNFTYRDAAVDSCNIECVEAARGMKSAAEFSGQRLMIDNEVICYCEGPFGLLWPPAALAGED